MSDMHLETVDEKPKVQRKSLSREILEWIFCFVIAFVVAVLVRYFIFTPTLVSQGSMTPTILDGERVLINRIVRTFHLPLYRGDIITFEKPDKTDGILGVYEERKGIVEFFLHNVLEFGKTSYIKRIIGLPGDHVLIKNGKVYVNDKKLDEVYLNGISTPIVGSYDDIEVPEGYYFVMGDNRGGSTDSRMFGCVPISKVEGRVRFRIWPPEKIGKIDD